MQKNISIGAAELEIMKVLWHAKEPMSTHEIAAAVEDMGWKRTTISTFLTRLAEKGAAAAEKRGRLYYYSPLITAGEYRRAQTRKLIRDLYHGSAKELAASLFEDDGLSEEDIRELRSILEQ